MSRRAVAPLTLALVLLAACGGQTGSGEDPTGGSSPTVAVDHRFGSTEVVGVPERVVVLDLQWTDTVLALGVQPVGRSVDAFMPGGDAPWQEISPESEVLEVADGLPLEEIAGLDPDLILGNYSIGDRATYDRLSAIAPTVPDLDDAQVGDWHAMAEVAGRVLDREEQAAEVVAAADDAVSTAAADLPGLRGRTFTLAQYVVGDQLYAVADEADGSSVLFADLGMEMFEPVRRLGEETGDARVVISQEQSDLLRADLLAFLVNGGDESDLADIPGFDRLPGTVAVLDYPTIVGLNTPTPLSVPYSLDALRPHLEQTAS